MLLAPPVGVKMLRLGIRSVRIGVGGIAGFLLWAMWRVSMTTTPESESIVFREFISRVLFNNAPGSPPLPISDTSLTAAWNAAIPIAIFLGAMFATLAPIV